MKLFVFFLLFFLVTFFFSSFSACQRGLRLAGGWRMQHNRVLRLAARKMPPDWRANRLLLLLATSCGSSSRFPARSLAAPEKAFGDCVCTFTRAKARCMRHAACCTLLLRLILIAEHCDKPSRVQSQLQQLKDGCDCFHLATQS